MAASKSEDTLTTEEISAGIAALSDADQARIRKVSVLLTGSSDAARDLRHDAIDRALAGERKRKCPRDVSIARFLCEVMRSIIWSQRNSDAARTKAEQVFVTDPTSEGRQGKVDPGPFAVLASEEECQRIIGAILNVFSDNDVAQTIAEGRMEGLTGEELCGLAGIDKKELATTHRLIRRRIEGAFPKGWHDGN